MFVGRIVLHFKEFCLSLNMHAYTHTIACHSIRVCGAPVYVRIRVCILTIHFYFLCLSVSIFTSVFMYGRTQRETSQRRTKIRKKDKNPKSDARTNGRETESKKRFSFEMDKYETRQSTLESTHMPKQQRTYCAYILAKLAIFILFSSSLFDALAFKFLRQNKTYLPRFTMIRDKMFCIILNKFGLISVMFFFNLRWIKYPISTAQTEQKRMEERKYE